MKDSFYSSFEKKYRGSRKVIKGRLEVYKDFYLPLTEVYEENNVVDLGCGRGEWIELLNLSGFSTLGVDLDEGMLSYCYDLNLNVKNQDIFECLKSLEDESVSIISSFHVVEHIGFDNVKVLVDEALRALKPGGLLIMETPNPENLVVGTNNFYLDPTHSAPIPNKLLVFLTEHAGFRRNKVIRLQELPYNNQEDKLDLMNVFEGVSPDYSVIAQKDASDEVLSKFTSVFNREIGKDLKQIVDEFSDDINKSFYKRDERINSFKEKIALLDEMSHKNELCMIEFREYFSEHIKSLEEKIENNFIYQSANLARFETDKEELSKIKQYLSLIQDELMTKQGELLVKQGELSVVRQELLVKQDELSVVRQEFQVKQDELSIVKRESLEVQHYVKMLHGSNSWKVTSPLRLVSRVIKRILRSPRTLKNYCLIKAKNHIRKYIFYVSQRPKLRRFIVVFSKRIGIYQKVRSIYHRSRVVPSVINDNIATAMTNMDSSTAATHQTELLSVYAQDIYKQLINSKL